MMNASFRKTPLALLLIITLVTGPAMSIPAPVLSGSNSPWPYKSSPQTTEHINLLGQFGGEARAIQVQGNFAFAGLGSQLAVIDLSDSAHPARTGWVAAAGEVMQIQLEGDYAYLAYLVEDFSEEPRQAGLQIIDIRQPTNPITRAVLPLANCALSLSLAVSGTNAYLSITRCSQYGGIIVSSGATLQRVEISDAEHPQLLETATIAGWLARGLAVSGSRAYGLFQLAADTQLRVFDVSGLNPLAELARLSVAKGGQTLALANEYAFIAAGSDGLQVVDITPPLTPTLVITHSLPGTAQRITLAGERAYLAAGTAGLRVVDLSNPANPVDAGSFPTQAFTQDVALSGGFVYLADGVAGLAIVNTNDLSFVAGLDVPDRINDLVYVAPYTFLAADDGLWTLDLSDPSLPVALSHLNNGSAASLAVRGDTLYLGQRSKTLRLINIADPSTPTEAAVYTLPDVPRQMYQVADRLYVAAGSSGLRILDLTQPLTLTEAGAFTPAYPVNAVAILGELAYLAAGDGNLHVVDVSKPEAPNELGFYDPPDRYYLGQTATSVQVIGTIAFMTTIEPPPTPLAGFYRGDVWTIDVSDPLSPTLLGGYYQAGAPYQLVLQGTNLFVAGERDGLRVLEVTYPRDPFLKARFNPSESIYGVTTAADFQLIYNASLFVVQYQSYPTYRAFLPHVEVQP